MTEFDSGVQTAEAPFMDEMAANVSSSGSLGSAEVDLTCLSRLVDIHAALDGDLKALALMVMAEGSMRDARDRAFVTKETAAASSNADNSAALIKMQLADTPGGCESHPLYIVKKGELFALVDSMEMEIRRLK